MGGIFIKKRIIFLSLIFTLLFFNLYPINSDAKLSDIFSFNSYFNIDYDHTILNEELKINKSINIPLTITYLTDVPEDFLHFIPKTFFMFKNKLIYNRSIPQQIVYIEITNSDILKWAQINLTQNKIYIEGIPYYDKEFIFKTSLILSPFEEAPSNLQTINIKIYTDDLGLLKGTTFEHEIQFKPRFTPRIEIKTDKSIRLVNPRSSVNFKINVKNFSNKKIRVDTEIDSYELWNPMINPKSIDINPNDDSYFIFSLTTPYDFGWYNTLKEFKINFTVQIFPLNENISKTGPYPITLKVKNYGFSTPGFDLFGLLVIFIFYKKLRGGKYLKTC